MALIDRGDVFDADLPAGAGAHPVVVVSRQVSIEHRSRVTVALVTSVTRGHPAEVPLGVELGLDHDSVANCDEIYTLPKALLTRRRGTVGVEHMRSIEAAIRLSLDL